MDKNVILRVSEKSLKTPGFFGLKLYPGACAQIWAWPRKLPADRAGGLTEVGVNPSTRKATLQIERWPLPRTDSPVGQTPWG